MERVVIVGNGIAGATAARIARKRGFRGEVVMISDEAPVPYSRPALMYVFMGHLRAAETKLYEDGFWPTNGIVLRQGRVRGLDAPARTITLEDGARVAYDRLLLATGSTPRALEVPGEHLAVRLWGLADVVRLERAVEGVRHAVVVGGGLTGVELCEMLRARGLRVTFLVREPRLMPHVLGEEESVRVEDELRRHGVEVRLATTVVEIEGRDHAEAVRTTDGAHIACELVAVAVGVRPNIDGFEESGISLGGRGGISVDEHLRTALPDVWAAGDCAELPGGRIEQLWYTARAQGAVAGCCLAGQPRAYAPGVPYNSAKFFSLEWQGYGVYAAGAGDRLRARTARADGQMLRLVTDETDRLVGMSSLGIRLRAELCRAWIARGLPFEEARARLPEARFDEEFSPRLNLAAFFA